MPNVKFHDGTPLTSADVKATYDRLRNPPQGVVSTRKATFADIGTIETPDPLTVVFKMKAVNASMLEHFASPWNVIYSAKDLAADPACPRTKINGTGPFTFVEHVKGSHVAGKKNDNYFKKGLPYLDGWKGVFTLQAAAMLNAVQGGQVLGEFRGISPAERDRLVQAMGDKIRIEELSWTLNLLVCFNVEKKPFDDVRVRTRAAAWRSTAGAAARACRASRRCARSAAWSAPARRSRRRRPSSSSCPASPRTSRSRATRPRSCWPKRACRTSSSRCGTATSPCPTRRPASSWSTSGGRSASRSSTSSPTPAPISRTMNAGNHDVAIDFSNLFMDDSSLGLAKFLSLSRAPENRSRSKDPELDKLYDEHMRERDPEKRKALIRAFEKRLFEQAYQQPLLWWHRIVPTHKVVMGWKMSPSHNLGADLAEVWLNK